MHLQHKVRLAEFSSSILEWGVEDGIETASVIAKVSEDQQRRLINSDLTLMR